MSVLDFLNGIINEIATAKGTTREQLDSTLDVDSEPYDKVKSIPFFSNYTWRAAKREEGLRRYNELKRFREGNY
jgi:hypothetical protein